MLFELLRFSLDIFGKLGMGVEPVRAAMCTVSHTVFQDEKSKLLVNL